MSKIRRRGYCFPAMIVILKNQLYIRFGLSFRNAKERRAERSRQRKNLPFNSLDIVKQASFRRMHPLASIAQSLSERFMLKGCSQSGVEPKRLRY
jgi:hypothetical protein